MNPRSLFITTRSTAYRTLKGIRHRHADPFATHLPVLMAVAAAQPVRDILELGSGVLSTPAFLDRSFFPDVERLVSHEDDPAWFTDVKSAVGGDPRCELVLLGKVRDSVPDDLSAFDLVFIDDSQRVTERSQTIRSVASRRPRGIVVIHDFEQRFYGRAARGAFDHVRRVKTFTPQTGVCWNATVAMDTDRLERALEIVEANRSVAPRDLSAWAGLLQPVRAGV
ncbi:MAG: hypothetical protein V9G19_13805 [Tetrasphaera sp.]